MTIQSTTDAKKQLGRLFLKRMPAKLRQCAHLLEQGEEKQWSADSTQKLQLQINRLIKSCHNFELEEHLKILNKTQQLFNHALQHAIVPDPEQIRVLSTELINMASTQDKLDIIEKEQVKPSIHLIPMTPAIKPETSETKATEEIHEDTALDQASIDILSKLMPTHDRPVLLILTPSAKEHIVESLQLFGYRCKLLQQSLELEATCQLEQPLAIIMPLPHSDEESESLRRIAQQSSTSFIFYTTMDTLKNRLKGVRSGGKGFLISPLESQEIILQLDRISTPLHDDPLRILVVEDSRSQGLFCVRTLKKVGMSPMWVDDPEQLMASIQQFQPELILMDMQLPDCNGIELAQILQQHSATSNIPVIYLSAEDDHEKRAQALSTAGEGFLSKPVQAEPLVKAVRHRAMRYRQTRELQESDQLTGLINRSAFRKEIDASISKALRDEVRFCIVLAEITGLDELRQGKGEAATERLTLAMANLLHQRVRCSDQVARILDGRFGILFHDCQLSDAENVMQAISALWKKLIQALVITSETSFVWTTNQFDGDNANELYPDALKQLLNKIP